ncbi:MAG: MFS transporter [Spirochaetota bacterium]
MTSWKRNLFATWFTQIFTITGFSISMPFLPFYIRTLGVTDANAIKFWVGVATAALSIAAAITAPVWGVLSDRHGRKVMLLRATLAGAIVSFCMGFAPNVQAFTVLRFVQGLFTGSIAAAAVLVSASTPKERLSYALGVLSTATFIGMSIGPMIGGYFAHIIGYRGTFFMSTAFVGVAFVLALTLIKEDRPDARVKAASFRDMTLLLNRTFIFALITIFFVRFSISIAMPFTALRIEEVAGVKDPSGMTGIILAVRSIIIALAGISIVRLADRVEKLGVLMGALALGALAVAPLFVTGDLLFFAVFFVLAGYFAGGSEPILQSFIGGTTSPSQRGMVFGMLTTVGSLGFFAAPIAGSAVAIAYDIRTTFLAQVICLGFTAMVIALYRLKHVIPVMKKRSGRGVPVPME